MPRVPAMTCYSQYHAHCVQVAYSLLQLPARNLTDVDDLMSQMPPTNLQRSVKLGKSLYVCGDHREAATLEGALRSGKRAAEAILQT